MRRIIKYIIIVIIGQLSLLSCEKDRTVLPERTKPVDIAVITKEYVEILKSSNSGWILRYKPEDHADSIYISLKFRDTTLTLLSSYKGYHTEQTGVHYSFEGKYNPIIVFPMESIFGELYTLFNASRKFKINYLEERQVFIFTRSDGYNDHEFVLEKANETNVAKLNEAIGQILELERLSSEVIRKFTEFCQIESGLYFRNLITERFSAGIDALDTLNNTIRLTYKETPVSAPASVSAKYSFYPHGIIITPAISYNSVVVDSIVLGELTSTSMEIIKAGNSGAGSMGYMHTPPYTQTLVENRNISSADWLMSTEFHYSNPVIYTQTTDDQYSKKANEYRAAFAQYLEANGKDVKTSTRLVHQIYLYSNSTPNNVQISTHKSTGSGNWFFPYRFTWEKAEGSSSQIRFNFYEAFNLATGLEEGLDEYFSHVFPQEGLTVWVVKEGTATRVRLISVKDSRVWVQYRISTSGTNTSTLN